MPEILSGELLLWGDHEVPFEAYLTEELDDKGLRVYLAVLPMFLDEAGSVLLISSVRLDLLPAYSTVALHFDPELPAQTVARHG